MEGSPACPFIAYEDERDERSTEPDHAHRCYAEVRPAPRALAHQEAYCLSSAFPVCPTFQAWARRESAQARSAAAATAASSAAASTASGPSSASSSASSTAAAASNQPPVHDPEPIEAIPEADPDRDDIPARRNPPRDWAAPPPWAGAAAAGAAANRSGAKDGPPELLASRSSEGQGLAGSAADRLAGGEEVGDVRAPAPKAPSNAPSAPADPELAGLVGGSAQAWSSSANVEPAEYLPPARPVKRQPVSSTRSHPVDRTPVQTGPSWESPRRYEAYPTIKTRTGMPDIPRVLLLAGALGIAALALFFLPALFNVGGKDGVGPSSSPSASVAVQTAAPSPTVPPAPTPQVYLVATGDTMTKIAKKFGVTVAQIMDANPTIKDPNKISLGQEIIIPVVIPNEVVDPSAGASP